RIDREAEEAFDLADFDGVLRALIQKADDHLVHAIDGVADAVDFLFSIGSIHKQKTPSRRREEVIDFSDASAPSPRRGARPRASCNTRRSRMRGSFVARTHYEARPPLSRMRWTTFAAR